MIFDAETLPDTWFAERAFDVCVIGSGPAGLTLARKLAASGKRVALMEGGGRDISWDSEELYEGDSVGAEYWPLTACRKRFLGGSSNCWSGVCRHLDAHDFDARPHHPWSGWPITKNELDPYAAETEEILVLPPDRAPPRTLFPGGQERFTQFEFRQSSGVFLGERYAEEVGAAPNLELYLHANLVDLELDDRLQRVTAGVFRSFERPEPFRVTADLFALCLGGLENPRFLLNANRQIAVGIGNQHDLVGRFFNEHPHQRVGTVLLAAPMRNREVYAPAPRFMAEAGILNIALLCTPDRRQLALPNELLRSTACRADFLRQLTEALHGMPLVCSEGGIEAYLEQWLNPAGMLTASLDIAAEQALNPASRVRLGSDRDRFGLRRIELDWRFSELDFHTVWTATVAFGELLAERDVGRLKLADWLLDPSRIFPGPDAARVGGPHHMCTTRMNDDPRQGVVDKNCRVHGMDNLYLGGSSVFATGGHANPTYTIVQLALRLADHLAASV